MGKFGVGGEYGLEGEEHGGGGEGGAGGIGQLHRGRGLRHRGRYDEQEGEVPAQRGRNDALKLAAGHVDEITEWDTGCPEKRSHRLWDEAVPPRRKADEEPLDTDADRELKQRRAAAARTLTKRIGAASAMTRIGSARRATAR